MTDPEIDQLARAAGTTTASPFDEPADRGRIVPGWAAHLMVALLVVLLIGLVVWGMTDDQFATLTSWG